MGQMDKGTEGKIEVEPAHRPGLREQRIPRGWYKRQDAADQVGKSKDTIRRWHREGIYEPSGYMRIGKLTVWLYNERDIAAMKIIAETIKPGPNKYDWP